MLMLTLSALGAVAEGRKLPRSQAHIGEPDRSRMGDYVFSDPTEGCRATDNTQN